MLIKTEYVIQAEHREIRWDYSQIGLANEYGEITYAEGDGYRYFVHPDSFIKYEPPPDWSWKPDNSQRYLRVSSYVLQKIIWWGVTGTWKLNNQINQVIKNGN